MWIPLLGVLLAGIVFMQVEVLKLNAGIGRSLERGSALQAQNELLRAGVSRLSDDQRIERVAAQLGMLMPSPEQLKFVGTGAGSTQRALSSIHAPNSTDFLAQLPTIGAAAAPEGATVNTGAGLASTGAPTASTSAADTDGVHRRDVRGDRRRRTTSAGTTAAGTTSSGTPASVGASTPQSAATTPAAPTTSSAPTASAGATDQSGSSFSGGAGATPVGG